MRKAILTAVVTLSALAAAGSAFAQTASGVTGDISVEGSVEASCQFSTDTTVVLNIGEMAVQSGAFATLGTYDHNTLDGETATLNGFCNGSASTMTVEATRMVNVDFSDPAPSGFEKFVEFTATAVIDDVASASDETTTPGAGNPATVGLFADDIVVTFSDSGTPGPGRLIAGDYIGTVVVTLTPAVILID